MLTKDLRIGWQYTTGSNPSFIYTVERIKGDEMWLIPRRIETGRDMNEAMVKVQETDIDWDLYKAAECLRNSI